MNVVYYIQGIITLILATDMARHTEIMDNFIEKRETFDFHEEDDLTAVMISLTLALINPDLNPNAFLFPD